MSIQEIIKEQEKKLNRINFFLNYTFEVKRLYFRNYLDSKNQNDLKLLNEQEDRIKKLSDIYLDNIQKYVELNKMK